MVLKSTDFHGHVFKAEWVLDPMNNAVIRLHYADGRVVQLVTSENPFNIPELASALQGTFTRVRARKSDAKLD